MITVWQYKHAYIQMSHESAYLTRFWYVCSGVPSTHPDYFQASTFIFQDVAVAYAMKHF